MSVARFLKWFATGFLCFWFAVSSGAAVVAETNSAPAEIPQPTAEQTASNETVRIYGLLQEQIRDAQSAIERISRENQAAAARNADSLAERLQQIERSVALQREAMESSGKFMLTVLSIFAGIGFVGIVLTAYFQWRTVSRLAEFASAVSPAVRSMALLPAKADAGVVESQLTAMAAAPVEQSNSRLVGAIERLEKRILELELTTHPPLKEPAGEANGQHAENGGQIDFPLPLENGAAEAAEISDAERAARIKALLDEGQSLLNADQAAEAVQCFDRALALNPDHTEALIKKGTALERLRKLQEAIECYDRAIAVDGSMTIAYLYKGGLYNRMERFSEAVECYELALRTQEKR